MNNKLPSEAAARRAEIFLAEHFHSEAVIEDVHEALALAFTEYEERNKEAEKWMRHSKGCRLMRTKTKVLIPCTCGLDDFKASTLLNQKGEGK